MKRWIFLGLLSIFLICPAVFALSSYTPDSGRGHSFDYPIMRIPIGEGASSNSNSGIFKDKSGQKKAAGFEDKQKQALDKKVDEAIKKAWGKQ